MIAGDLARARCKTQIDVGFGDAVTPVPVDSVYPLLLKDMPAPRLRTYPTHTVIAEKLHAIALLGMTNTGTTGWHVCRPSGLPALEKFIVRLAHRQAGEDGVREECRRLHHAPGIAQGADTTAFAGIGDHALFPFAGAPASAVGAKAAALHIGALAFIYRFGSSLNGHVYFHVCVVDGVFEEVAGQTNA